MAELIWESQVKPGLQKGITWKQLLGRPEKKSYDSSRLYNTSEFVENRHRALSREPQGVGSNPQSICTPCPIESTIGKWQSLHVRAQQCQPALHTSSARTSSRTKETVW